MFASLFLNLFTIAIFESRGYKKRKVCRRVIDLFCIHFLWSVNKIKNLNLKRVILNFLVDFFNFGGCQRHSIWIISYRIFFWSSSLLFYPQAIMMTHRMGNILLNIVQRPKKNFFLLSISWVGIMFPRYKNGRRGRNKSITIEMRERELRNEIFFIVKICVGRIEKNLYYFWHWWLTMCYSRN